MEKKEIHANFLGGHCDRITDYVSLEQCQKLHQELNQRLRTAGCKCRHGGIRKRFLNHLSKIITPEQ